jgi:peptidoglycan/xylan/chitin deacetylase (PgdA/CDA1 family)
VSLSRISVGVPEFGRHFDCPDPSSKERALAAIAALAEADGDWLAAVKAAMSADGIDCQAAVRSEALTVAAARSVASRHMVSDISVSPCRQPPEVEREMADSRRLLENILQCEVRHFSYPFGACGPREAQIAQSVGFRTAVTIERGTLFPQHLSHTYALTREPMVRKETASSCAAKSMAPIARSIPDWVILLRIRNVAAAFATASLERW